MELIRHLKLIFLVTHQHKHPPNLLKKLLLIFNKIITAVSIMHYQTNLYWNTKEFS